MMKLAFLCQALEMVQGVAGAAASAHEGHVLLPGEGHWEVNFDEVKNLFHVV